MNDQARRVHEQSIVIDGVCPLLYEPWHVDRYIKGGATAVAPTVGMSTSAHGALTNIAQWHRLCRDRDDLMLIRRASDILVAKQEKKLGIVLHFQGTDAIEDNVDLVDAFHALSVKVMQLTYNVRGRVGDGCTEPSDAGLSVFGKRVVRRMNDLGIIVDCSHTGYRTTMDAIAESSAPVILSHANSYSVHPSQRNVKDDVIKAIGDNGGIVGVVGYAPFLGTAERPTIDDLIRHIDHHVQLIGPDRVVLGLDYYIAQHPIAPLDKAMAIYEGHVKSGRWSKESYPPPPYYYPTGLETPDELPNLTARLLERGYSEQDVGNIMGGNWYRMYQTVWKD